MPSGVNFNMLSPIAAPKVVGSIAPSNNQNNLNSLAGGLMTGFQQGQQIAGNALQMAAQKQQMDQANELFPLKMQAAQQDLQANAQTIEKNAMEIANAKQKQQTAAEMRANFKQSWDQGMQWLAQNDPVKYQELQIKGAEYEKNIATAAKDSADAVKQQLANANQIAIFGADLAQTASNGRNPQEQQAIYTMRRNQLAQTAPELAKVFPTEFNDNTQMMLIKGGMDAIIRQKEEEERKTPAASPLGKMQQDINAKQKVIDRKKQQGIDTTTDEQQLAALQQQASDVGKKDAPVSELDKNLGKQEAIRYKESQDAITNANTLNTSMTDALGQLEKTPALALGPAASVFNANKNVPEVQQLKSMINEAALQLRTTLMKGAGSMSDADRVFLEEVVGGTAANKSSLKEIFTRLQKISQKSATDNYKIAEGIMKRSSDYKAWKESNPEPMFNKSPKSYTLNGTPFDMEAAKKATGLSEEEIIKQAGLK